MEAPLGQNVLSTHTGLNLFLAKTYGFHLSHSMLRQIVFFSPKNLNVQHNNNGKDEVKEKCHTEGGGEQRPGRS